MKIVYFAAEVVISILLNPRPFSVFVILFSLAVMTIISSYSSNKVGSEHNLSVQAQVLENNQQPQQQPLTSPPRTGMPAVKITSHSSGQQVKAGPLTISGTSSDTPSTDCEVYADWNDNKPFGKAIAIGPGGPDDYSKWTFIYDGGYHLIQNGTNNLTSKITCLDGSTILTKWNSINLIGVVDLDSGALINQAITSSPTPSNLSSTTGLPLPTPSQENEEDEEDNENDDDSDSDDTNGDNEEENEEGDDEADEVDDEGNGGSGDQESENGDEEDDGGGGDDDNNDGSIDFGPNIPVD